MTLKTYGQVGKQLLRMIHTLDLNMTAAKQIGKPELCTWKPSGIKYKYNNAQQKQTFLLDLRSEISCIVLFKVDTA